MLGACIDLELLQLLTAEGGLGEHAANGALDDLLRVLLHSLAEALGLEAAIVAAVTVVDLGVSLVTGKLDLIGVDDNHKVTAVRVRGVLRLGLAAQNSCDLSGKAAQDSALGVDEDPVAGNLALLGVVSLLLKHLTPPCTIRVLTEFHGALQSNLSSIPRNGVESTHFRLSSRVSAQAAHSF